MSLLEWARQMMWVKRAVIELAAWNQRKFDLNGDNTGSISLAKNPVFHSRSKHIEVHYHYIREKLEAQEFSVSYVPTGDIGRVSILKDWRR